MSLQNIDSKLYEALNQAEIAEVSLEEWIDDYCVNETEKEKAEAALELIRDAMELLTEATNTIEEVEE